MMTRPNLIADLTSTATWRMPSAISLVAVNLVPLYGALFLGWEVFPILFLFWAEGVVIGVFHILRMLAVESGSPALWAKKVFMIPFFMVHYGMFTLVHGIFVVVLFGGGGPGEAMPDGPDPSVFLRVIHDQRLAWPIMGFVLSHALSFVTNFIGKGEYRVVKLDDIFATPYGRVILMHVTILASGFLMMAFSAPAAGLVILVALKTVMDLSAHLKERRGWSGGQNPQANPE